MRSLKTGSHLVWLGSLKVGLIGNATIRWSTYDLPQQLAYVHILRRFWDDNLLLTCSLFGFRVLASNGWSH